MQQSTPSCGIDVVAVDTNIIIRLLTGDDTDQFERARKLFDTDTILLPKTVVLEAEWVLRRLYGIGPAKMADALSALVALPQVHCEDATAINTALRWLRQGLDFADALHLASSRAVGCFATFDRNLTRRARRVVTNCEVTAP